MKRIDSKTLHAWLLDGHELALLDAREDGEFGASHLFWAVPCPLSKREIRARALVPRLGARICCVDDGRGLAEQLAAWLEGVGAADVAVLTGGTKAWPTASVTWCSGSGSGSIRVGRPWSSRRPGDGWASRSAPT